jgi:hypothetical protein
MDPGDRFCTRGRVVYGVSTFALSRKQNPSAENTEFPKNDARHRSSRPLPRYFSSWRAAVCVSREHSGDVEVVLDIDRDELDNEIQDPFFESFPWIFSS